MSIVSMNGTEIPDVGCPNELAIECLEKILEQAKSGEIKGVCVATMNKDDIASYMAYGATGGYSMIGALSIMQQELTEAMLERERGYE
jgi:hypothetical protein